MATLTLNRPERKNALGPADWQALGSFLQEIADNKAIRALLLQGAGGAFSSGGDLRSMPERLEWPAAVREQQLRSDGQVVANLFALEIPTIAAIEGPCLGAGLALALACDLRIATTSASFGAVFHRVGLSADFGLSFLLPHAVGQSRASELLLTAEVCNATRAQEIGMVHRVVAPAKLHDEALRLCEQLAEGPPLALAQSKRALRRSASRDLQDAISWEAQGQTLLGKSADAREGVAAFLAKRPPHFRGV